MNRENECVVVKRIVLCCHKREKQKRGDDLAKLITNELGGKSR